MTISDNPTLARVQSTMPNADKKPATSKEARRVFGRSMADITKAVDEARGIAAPVVAAPLAEAEPVAAPAEGPAAVEGTVPATETPATETPDPMRAREAKLVEGQQRLARERREFDAYRTRTESELATAREVLRLSKEDPLGFFEKHHGIKREAFVQVMGQKAAPPTPGALSPEVARELEEGRAFRQSFERERHERMQREEQDRFAAQAAAGAQKWPLASRFSPSKLKARGWDIAVEHARQGVTLTNDEILDKLEDELGEYAALVRGSATKRVTIPAVETGRAASTAAQPTLTTRDDSEASPPARTSPHPSSRDRIAKGVAAVEEMLRKK